MLRRIGRFFSDLTIDMLKAYTRITSFIGKEMTEVWRRPGVLVSLILGPLIVMALFGAGFSGVRKPLETLVVVPSDNSLPGDPDFYRKLSGPNINILGVTQDAQAAQRDLAAGRVQLVVVAPSQVEQRFQAGQQSSVQVLYDEVNPILDNYARLVAQQQVNELNRTIIEQVVTQGQNYVVQNAGNQPGTEIPPGVVAAPTRADTRNMAPVSPSVMQFYAPAVLALVLQHMAVTLTALSIVRERLSGAMDIFRVAPVRVLEILLGKYVAYSFMNLVLAGIVTGLMVAVLKVPLLGDPLHLAGVVALLTFASVGLGLLISTIADSERQAVQLSMLVLLASVFLSGFVLSLDQFNDVVRNIAYALPVTHGIRLMQDDMLRGASLAVWQLWVLGGLGVVLFLLDNLTLRRNMDTL